MSHYRKKPVVVEAFSWDEIMRYAKEHGTTGPSGGAIWHFNFRGHNITHERDDLYLITTLEGVHQFTPDDMLIVGVAGEIYACKRDIFIKTYTPDAPAIVHIDTADNFHPWECDGPGKCIHCDRTKNERHNPQTCALCDNGGSGE